MTETNIKDFLPLVSRPGRYIGGEINSVRKNLNGVSLKTGLAFPDVYEIGMSHLGIQILYQILNSRDDIACERVFSPWDDMERLLADKGMPLTTLESGIPLRELDILGFSIQYELSYTNILAMLGLGRIPLYSRDRGKDLPLIIGGGPIAFNPEPIADFFDAFVLGEGEEAVLDIADAVIAWKQAGAKTKEDLLKMLAGIDGVYVPSFFNVTYNDDGTIKKTSPLVPGYTEINKRVVPDINALSLPVKPVVPFPQTVHDHLSVEINRGCTRGCRFCQAGMVYRPNRERSPENIIKLIDEALKNTGYDEVSFLSLSAGDYSCIQDILIGFMDSFAEKKIAVSLPSLRVGTLSARLAEEIKRVRKTGFTMAPEAGSERLRLAINKGIDEKDLIETARNVFSMGWRSIKLYFMIGLPTETIDDIKGIVELSRRVQEAGKASGFRPTVNVSVSQFVPKPHTPFQWEPQITREACLERQDYLRRELKKYRLEFKWHDSKMSLLEGIFARGDRRLSRVIHAAYEQGCRFDSWGDHLKFDVWEDILKRENISPAFYANRRRAKDELFPWDHLHSRVDTGFLFKEYERAMSAANSTGTPDCKLDKCSVCGICDYKVIKNVSFYEKPANLQPAKKPSALNPQASACKIRLDYSKTGDMKYLGHLEFSNLFSRAMRRAGIPIAYSAGFHPLPKIAFGQPLPVGIESIAETIDMELTEFMRPEDVRQRLNQTLPEGIKILTAMELPVKKTHCSAQSSEATYIIFLEKSILPQSFGRDRLEETINRALAADRIIITQEREGKTREVDIRPLIKNISLMDDNAIQLITGKAEGAGAKPHEIVAHILGISQGEARLLKILKTKAGSALQA